ncbi:response regulator transcription factor [Novosphingobium taihuense]|uniref:response regulator transcription factor n=1 Tax=Novosphingobium taihuense TaxID=260085 RepID=UPI001199DC78|nr:helix-turn-helix transcriptional regulator [Novosphingobium taihuense]TWH78543.1 regulatory LuxR family protein [Novosphingobium taihuense]
MANSNDDSYRSAWSKLSNRQKRVISGMIQGLTSAEMSEQMGISIRTVENHRVAALRALGFRRANQAIPWLLRLQIAELMQENAELRAQLGLEAVP